jgi:hypothetical protein
LQRQQTAQRDFGFLARKPRKRVPRGGYLLSGRERRSECGVEEEYRIAFSFPKVRRNQLVKLAKSKVRILT